MRHVASNTHRGNRSSHVLMSAMAVSSDATFFVFAFLMGALDDGAKWRT
jgi:hypothetical protein